MAKILLVEDERVIRAEIKRILTRDGHDVRDVASVPAAEQERPESFDLVITDVRLTGETGDVLIERVGQVPVIVMTAYGSVGAAVDAMKRGAADYLSKPFEPEALSAAVDRVLRHRASSGTRDIDPAFDPFAIVTTESSPMQAALRCARKVAPTEATVLILGESGTGKELIARAVHNQSARTGPFVPVNCASIPETLLESELFGHEKGAFTGALARRDGLVHAANGGTLFLDEIGELSQAAQARLLRMLQQREVRRVGAQMAEAVDIRLIAATHRNLPTLVERQNFGQISTFDSRSSKSNCLRSANVATTFWPSPRCSSAAPLRSSAAGPSSFRRVPPPQSSDTNGRATYASFSMRWSGP